MPETKHKKEMGAGRGPEALPVFVVHPEEHLPEPRVGGVQKFGGSKASFPPPCGLENASRCFITFSLG